MAYFFLFLSLFLVWLNPGAVPVALADPPPPEAVVRAVLFYSPNCGHCHLVISEVLPPLFEEYGDQLDIVGIDITQPGGQALFQAAIAHFNIESAGVPFLVIGDTYLVGSVEIPEKLPGLIEQHLVQGGLDWPAIPGLVEALASTAPAESPTPAPPEATLTAVVTTTALDSPVPAGASLSPTPGLLLNAAPTGGLGANFARDRLGNSLAVIVLGGMLFSVGGAVFFIWRKSFAAHAPLTRSWNWLIPILCLIGLWVAGYLAYVETAQVEAVCGPVGDCNTVQQSQYARLFGLLPIGALGLAGYVMILLAWLVGRSARERLAAYASLALLGLTAFGVLFSIYLTFLEPFVIGATCAWCLTSAVIITALFWLSLVPARLAYFSLRCEKEYSLKQGSSAPAENQVNS